MRSCDAPQRVFALQSANETTVWLYGVGTYVGDLPCPQKAAMFGGEEALRSIVADNIKDSDAVPVEKSTLVQMFESFGPSETLKTIEDAIAATEAERARPLEERVQDAYEGLLTNPCIQLDSGDTIWGMQCWWGPEERMDEKIAGRTIVQVDVPEGNERWK